MPFGAFLGFFVEMWNNMWYNKGINYIWEKSVMANFFADSFDKIAEVIRILYVYGCFSNDDFDDPVIRGKINEFVIAPPIN